MQEDIDSLKQRDGVVCRPEERGKVTPGYAICIPSLLIDDCEQLYFPRLVDVKEVEGDRPRAPNRTGTYMVQEGSAETGSVGRNAGMGKLTLLALLTLSRFTSLGNLLACNRGRSSWVRSVQLPELCAVSGTGSPYASLRPVIKPCDLS